MIRVLWNLASSLFLLSSAYAGTFNLGSDITVNEGDGFATITVTRTDSSAAENITVSTQAGTASSPSDYTALILSPISFAIGETTQDINIPLIDDTDSECSEEFQLSIIDVPVGDSISGGSVTITIAENDIQTLAWDDGTLEAGNNGIFTQALQAEPSITCFRIVTSNVEFWRTRLTVLQGEASLEMHRGPFTASDPPDHSSATAGSDGILLYTSQFQASQEWYIRVTAQANSAWELFSGDIFVHDRGTLLVDTDPTYTPFNTSFPPEEAIFFSATPPVGARAWALWLNGYQKDSSLSQIAVRKNQPGLPLVTNRYNYREKNQMLLVPPYFGDLSDTYFVSVQGNEGDTISIDSHLIAPEPLSTSFTQTGVTQRPTGTPYAIYEVDVPENFIAWDVTLTNILQGTPDIAIAQGDVPSRWNNIAYSESPGTTNDSITLVPNALTDGSWFITVYSDGDFETSLANGQPEFTGGLTDIDFLDDDTQVIAPILQPGNGPITNPQPNRSGWVYFRSDKIAEQSGLLGWFLSLTNQIPDTEIAIRQNAVPSRLYRRNASTTSAVDLFEGIGGVGTQQTNYYDANSDLGFLQRPSQQADVWYVGIHLQNQALGAFDLSREELIPSLAPPNNFLDTVNAGNPHLPRSWRFYRFDLLDGIRAWQTSLDNVVGGHPKVIVRRALLPNQLFTSTVNSVSNWNNGISISSSDDWFTLSGTDRFRSLIASAGDPLVTDSATPITYYVGVFNDSDTSSTYDFSSTVIDDDTTPYAQPIELIQDIPFSGGVSNISSLPAGQESYFRVSIPANTRSWRLRLNGTSGDARLFVKKDVVPDYSSRTVSDALTDGSEMARPGSEVYHLLPRSESEFIEAGDYYIVVVAEETGTFSGSVLSEGAIPITSLGIPSTQITTSYSLPADEIALYQFEVPANALAVEVRLNETSGRTDISTRDDTLITRVSSTGSGEFTYGHDGGNSPNADVNKAFTYQNPDPGIYSITLRAERETSTVPLASSGQLAITIITPPALALEGTSTVTNQEPESWRYFRVDIPATGILPGDTTPILAWKPRLANVSANGRPRMVLIKGQANNSTSSLQTIGFSPFNPPKNTSWPNGATWAASRDLTNRSQAAGNLDRLFHSNLAAWGKPLDGGTYYIGVYNSDLSNNCSYDLISETIGEPSSSSAIKVVDLAFTGGSSTISSAPVRDVQVFRVTVPAGGAPSWRARLESAVGSEINLAVREGFVPDYLGGTSTFVNTVPNDERSTVGGGNLISKEGNECYQLLPEEGQASLPANQQFYITAASLGNNPTSSATGTGTVNYTVFSDGAIPSTNLTLTGGLHNSALTFKPGETQLFTFTVPPNSSSLEVALENKTGNKLLFALRQGTLIPEPYRLINNYENAYGIDEGTRGNLFFNENLVTVADPPAGVYTLAIRSTSTSETNWQNTSTADLRIEVLSPQPLAFCNGSANQVNQPPLSWRYFEVVVPADDSATRTTGLAQSYLGWDVGLFGSASGGNPEIYTRKVALPELSGAPSQNRFLPWVDGNQLRALGSDWTNDSTRFSDGVSIDRQRDLFQGGQLLLPGIYYIGVYNNSTTQSTSYTIQSRCVGSPNSGADFIVNDLAFNGGTDTTTVDSREAAYYKVSIPPNTHRSWRVKLENEPTLNGETSLVIRKDYLPLFNAGETSDATLFNGSILMQRQGDEIYSLLPPNNSEWIPGGDYFIAVVGRGSTTAANNVSPGNATFTIESVGAIPEISLGAIGATGTNTSQALSLESSEIQIFNFSVSPSQAVEVLEIRLDNRVGNPHISYRNDNRIPQPNTAGIGSFRYGYDSGNSVTRGDDQIITLINPEVGDYTITVHARGTSFNPTDATASLIVENVGTAQLAYSSALAMPSLPNTRMDAILDGQKRYFEVTVPDSISILDDEITTLIPTIGWKINLEETTGNGQLRVMSNLSSSGGFNINSNDVAIVVPPFLIPGNTYYIEVTGFGLTDYTITSEAVTYFNNWNMPEDYNITFGDSNEQDLAQDDWHFYAIDVPKSNGGLLRTELISLSGNPDLYIREDGVPTINHSASGSGGSIFNRILNGTDTEYANWVPLNGRTEVELRPGRWVLGVRANGSNSRYRLLVSTGDVEDIALVDLGNVLNDRTILSNDFKYYRVEIPEIPNTPASLAVTFAEDFGDINLHLRDTIPPGNSTQLPSSPNANADRIVDADDDNKNTWTAWGSSNSGFNNPGTYDFPFPNLRPGATYFIGIRGRLDATYDLTTDFSAEFVTDAPGSSSKNTYGAITDLDFFNGSITFNLAPNSYRALRIPVPAGATRWIHNSTHSSSVQFRLEQGTLPFPSGSSNGHLISNNMNSGFNRDLTNNQWPWVPGEDYYALFINNSGATESVTFNLLGEGALDQFAGWASSFGLTGPAAEPSAINNPLGITNLMSYALDLNPTTGKTRQFSNLNPLPWIVIDEGTTTFAGLEFLIPNNAPQDLCYIVEENKSLSGVWNQLGIRAGNGGWIGSGNILESNVTSSLYKRQTILSPTSVDSEAKNFFRLRVELLHP